MLGTIAWFELRKRLGMISTYVYLALFFAFGLLVIFASGGAFSDVSAGAGAEKVHANAPISLYVFITNLSSLGVILSAAIFGQAVHQDFESRIDAILFTAPIKKSSYLGGRFLGAFVFTLLVFFMIGLGMFAGAHSPFFIDKSLFGPTPLSAYLWPYLIGVIPNLVFTGSLFFLLGALGRRMMPVYLGAIIAVVAYLMAGILLQDLDNRTLAALVDPFGGTAMRAVARYWTPAESNANLPPLTGLVLGNRLLWSGLGLACLGFVFRRFRMGHGATAEARTQPKAEPEEAIDATGAMPQSPIARSDLDALFTLTRLALAETIKNTYFAVLVVAGATIAVVSMSFAGKIFGTPTWPVTHAVASLGEASFSLFILIIITFYAGEIVWRERDLNLAQITDALPLPTWIPYLAKLISLCMVPAVLLLAVIVTGVGFQTVHGYHHYQFGLYFQLLYLYGLPTYIFLCVLSFVVQSVVQNKYLGHFVIVLFYVGQQFMDTLGLQHRLLKYSDTPNLRYSEMNGFGHFAKPTIAYDFYWTGFAILLAVAGALLWNRGTEAPFRARLQVARARFTLAPKLLAALGLLIAAGAGSYIYYNEDVLNHFRTSHQQETLRAEHEKKYKALEKTPQPRITDIKVDFDIFPESESLDVRGAYVLVNKTSAPIDKIYVETDADAPFESLRVGDVAAPTTSDVEQGFHTYQLPAPLAPGASIPLTFVIHVHDRGFKDQGNRTDLAANGTFFNSGNLPAIGYQRGGELVADNDRKKYGLAPRDRLPDLNDQAGLANSLISSDSDWVNFESTVSTSPDQIAITPGYLQKEWTENGRRYFHYKMDAPILGFYSVLSARYAEKKDAWNGVNLEIYYQPGHEYDLDEMMRGMKDALAYCSDAFGPYQFRQARILEFPRYQMFAQSFPNTIPFSESLGFIARVRPEKPDDIDYPYYVTAHEIAHQWWAHQVIGGNVQGVTLLDETLAQYTALMVMKARFGPPKMRRFLKYELDQYLRGRALEQKKEVPILRVENQQYIHYNKGSLVMYALQDYLGEATVNKALKAFLDAYKFKGPPYPNAQALLDEFKKVTPPELQYLLHDLFETITLYDNRALTATAKKLGVNRYEVTIKVTVKKMQAGEQGAEKEVPADDFIDVGALDADGAPIALVRQHLKSGESEIKLLVDKMPAKAGIDPLNKLVDRVPDDNTVPVTE